MVSSMTGFTRQTHEQHWGVLTWEIRSVNHRYLEISVRMPEHFRQLEMAVRERVQKQIKRGKVEVSLKFAPGVDVPFDLVVNESLLTQLANASKLVEKHFPNSSVNPMDILSWQGILETKQTHMEKVSQAALELLDKSLDDLVAVRRREGESIKTFLGDRLQNLVKEVKTVETSLPTIREQARERVMNRFAELSIELDSDRLEQEMVWLLQKMDVAEEIQRLYAHVDETKRILGNGHVIGRRLDFLMQEFNREANTLGSKSTDTNVTKAVVELKVNIEQMREQVQNVE